MMEAKTSRQDVVSSGKGEAVRFPKKLLPPGMLAFKFQ